MARLLRQSDAVAARLYPGEYRRPITPDYLDRPGTYLLVARWDGAAVGLCVIFDREDGSAELKRMIVEDGFRGIGIGRALVAAADAMARTLGATALLLEVGIHNHEAQALYARSGYQPCPPFLPYREPPVSLFRRKDLRDLSNQA